LAYTSAFLAKKNTTHNPTRREDKSNPTKGPKMSKEKARTN